MKAGREWSSGRVSDMRGKLKYEDSMVKRAITK